MTFNDKGWGGKRQNAGRKKLETIKKTKVVRIPEEVDVEKILSLKEDIKTLIHAWRVELHPTSPRDESARKMIEELEELL